MRCWFCATFLLCFVLLIHSCSCSLQVSAPAINHRGKSIELLGFMWVWCFSLKMICSWWATRAQRWSQFKGSKHFPQIVHWQKRAFYTTSYGPNPLPKTIHFVLFTHFNTKVEFYCYWQFLSGAKEAATSEKLLFSQKHQS